MELEQRLALQLRFGTELSLVKDGSLALVKSGFVGSAKWALLITADILIHRLLVFSLISFFNWSGSPVILSMVDFWSISLPMIRDIIHTCRSCRITSHHQLARWFRSLGSSSWFGYLTCVLCAEGLRWQFERKDLDPCGYRPWSLSVFVVVWSHWSKLDSKRKMPEKAWQASTRFLPLKDWIDSMYVPSPALLLQPRVQT